MANCLKTREKEARRDTLYNFLKQNPGKYFTARDVAPVLGVAHGAALRDINAMLERDGIVGGGRSGVSYIYTPSTEDRYPITKNNEGYSDPTAAYVLKMEERKEKKEKQNSSVSPKPGDVWDLSVANSDRVDKYIVLAVDEKNGYATVIPCSPIRRQPLSDQYTKLCTKPIKYFIQKVWGEPLSVMTEIRSAIAEYLDIQPEKEVVEIEKEVIKEVPVKVEVPVQVSSDLKYTEEDMQKMRADIWEECFKLVVRKESEHII